MHVVSAVALRALENNPLWTLKPPNCPSNKSTRRQQCLSKLLIVLSEGHKTKSNKCSQPLLGISTIRSLWTRGVKRRKQRCLRRSLLITRRKMLAWKRSPASPNNTQLANRGRISCRREVVTGLPPQLLRPIICKWMTMMISRTMTRTWSEYDNINKKKRLITFDIHSCLSSPLNVKNYSTLSIYLSLPF